MISLFLSLFSNKRLKVIGTSLGAGHMFQDVNLVGGFKIGMTLPAFRLPK